MGDANEADRLLYQENAKVLAIFLEWRHKVMTHWFAVTGAVLGGAGWLYQQPKLHAWLVAPFLMGSLFSVLSALLDRRNVRILKECCLIGGQIELRLATGGIFKFIGDTHSEGIT